MIKRSTVFFSAKSLTALAAAFVLILLSLLPFFDVAERRFLDLAFILRGPEKPHPGIVIVDINDQSLSRFGSWPWPRTYYASVLTILEKYKPRAVFFDILFPEPSTAENDTLFAYTISKAGNIILPFYFPVYEGQMLQKPDGMPLEAFRNKAKALGYANVFPESDGHIQIGRAHV